MPCYKPLQAWYGKDKTSNGKNSIVFTPTDARDPDSPIELPCGQCVGCRLERSRQWAVRCMHEAELHDDNCFITLTFNDDALSKRAFPESLDVRDFQLFMKRLRKKYGSGIRFFHCGEYGEKYGRPHYHACLFGFDFPDKQLFSINNGQRLYISESLQKLWPYGFATIGSVTFESAAYVARYIMKKITGDMAVEHYCVGVDTDTGEMLLKKPEYTTMSRREGIGKGWFEKYHKDVYPHDYVVVNGKKCKPPRYYDKLLAEMDLGELDYEIDDIKAKRYYDALEHTDNNTPERLAVREEIQLRKLNQLPRIIDNET